MADLANAARDSSAQSPPEESLASSSEDQATADEASPSTREELRAAALHGVRWTSIGRVVVELSLLGSMVVLARLIPPAEFGPYAVAIVAQELVLGIQSQGVGNALVQRPKVGREHLQAGHAIMLLSGVALAGLTLLAARFIAQPIFGQATATLVALTAPFCIVSALGIVPLATLRRRLAFKRLTVIDMVSSAFRVGGSIGLAVAGLGGKSLIFGTLAGTAVASMCSWASAPPPAPRLRRRPARELLDYGLPASLASVSWTCFRNCDYAIIGARLGTLEAGLYFRAYQLAVEYQKKVSDLTGTVAFPVLSRTGSADDLSALRGKVVRLLTLLLFPLLTLLAIIAPVFIPWLLGPAWAPTVVPTQILALGGGATLAMDTAGVALAAAGRSRAMLGFGVSHFVVYAAVVWVVAPDGITAVAIGAAVVHTAFLFVSYVLMLSGSGEPPIRHLFDDVAPACVGSLGLAALAVPASLALTAADVPVILNVLGVSVLACAGYILTVRAGFPRAWRELTSSLELMLPIAAVRRGLRRIVRRPRLVGARSVS